ncbi:MAG TPA: PAS domain S-box protein, partial [Kofleriaceae bacterium]|nr:PAS domain S-box protein [Kofleriaceae bacterium]
MLRRIGALFAAEHEDGDRLLAGVADEARVIIGAARGGVGEPPAEVASPIVTPVRGVAGEVVGTLWFEDPGDARARELVETIATLAGVAVERAALARRLTASQQELARLARRAELVNAATDEGIWYWDVAADTVEWNDTLPVMHGFDRFGWAGTFDDWFQRLHPSDQPRLAQALKDHLETRAPYRIERFQLRHAEGEYRWFTTAGQAAWGEDGAPVCMAGSVRDITAEVMAAEELRANEHRYAQILDSVQDMIFCKNERLAVTYANAAACRYYGVTREQLRSPTDVPATPMDVTPQHHLDDRHVFDNGVVIERNAEPNRAADGQVHYFDTVKAPVRNALGQVVELVGVSRDITNRKREEEKRERLHVASELLARSIDFDVTLTNVAKVIVPEIADWCAIDLVEDGTIRRVAIEHPDPAMIELAIEFERRYPAPPDSPNNVPAVIRTGVPEMMTGLTDETFVASARDAEHLAMMRAMRLHSYIIVPMNARDQRLGAITLIGQGTRTLDEDDLAFAEELARRASSALENALLYREVRELNASLEQRVAERTAALTAANEELESFSYTVSHDLRAPVRHIGGFADLLVGNAGDVLDDKARHFVDRIKVAATHMGMLVDGLLAFSRLGRTELFKRSIALGKVVATVREELEPELRGRQV